MPVCFEPKLDVLPQAQKEIWEALKAAPSLGFALYGGTGIALQLGHRQSVDFDFFSSDELNKDAIATAFPFVADAIRLQDSRNTLVVLATIPAGQVKISFFGGIGFGRVNDPVQTADGVLLVASLDDLMATKLKAILDRAEAKDYRDIAAMLSAGVDLGKALSAFKAMFGGEPRTALMAMGYFADGDVSSITDEEKQVLVSARDRVRDLPRVDLIPGSLVGVVEPCDEIVDPPVGPGR